jgi:hypothetical protein
VRDALHGNHVRRIAKRQLFDHARRAVIHAHRHHDAVFAQRRPQQPSGSRTHVQSVRRTIELLLYVAERRRRAMRFAPIHGCERTIPDDTLH